MSGLAWVLTAVAILIAATWLLHLIGLIGKLLFIVVILFLVYEIGKNLIGKGKKSNE